MTEIEKTEDCAAVARGRPAPDRRGFTLVEVLVVVAISTILLTIGVPSYLWTTSSFRISTEANALVGDLQYARSEAVKQGITVSICVSTDGATCSTTTTSWAAGHIVISNPTAAAGTVLRVQAAFSGTDTAADITNGVAQISFNRDGFAGVPSTTAWNGFASLPAPVYLTVHDAANTASLGSCVLISPVGQISVLAKNVGGCT